MDLTLLDTEFLRPLVNAWVGKIEMAERARSEWKQLADECLLFYGKSAQAMWDPLVQRKFWKQIKAPRFKITLNKAFEYVAIYGPSLVWDVPHRNVLPKLNQTNAFIVDEQTLQTKQIVAALQSLWLNYTPHEQPNGGLRRQAQRATTDALIEGRGLLAIRPYQMPGSQRILTGCFREDPRNFLCDPDETDPTAGKWIALRRVSPVWEVERRFELPLGILADKASLESTWAYGESRGADFGQMHRVQGKSNDLMVWYEIFSKMGPGVRKTDVPVGVKEQLEEVLGDYVYWAISPQVPYPLNLTTNDLRSGIMDDDVRKRCTWPVEFWRDDRYPVELLDFYEDNKSCWPVPPLAPGLGQLRFMNAMISWLANRIWSSSRDFWAVAQAYMQDLEKHLNDGDDQCVIPLRGDAAGDIRKILSVIQQPETRYDAWRILDMVSMSFDKAVGLTDFMYGQSDTQDRSAETTRSRMQMLGVRPDYMRMQVKDWMSRCGAAEAMCAHMFVSGQDLLDYAGPQAAQLWDQVLKPMPIETVMRQMHYDIAAASLRRPDRDRDRENANAFLQQFGPIADAQANATGDTAPLNWLARKVAEAMELDITGFEFGDRRQEPSQEEMMAMQAQQQHDLQLKQADLAMKQANVQTAEVKAATAQQSGQMSMLQQALQLQAERERANIEATRAANAAEGDAYAQQQKLVMKQLEHEQALRQKQQMNDIDTANEVGKSLLKLAQQREQRKSNAKTKKPAR